MDGWREGQMMDRGMDRWRDDGRRGWRDDEDDEDGGMREMEG